jgi:hypothetical protein
MPECSAFLVWCWPSTPKRRTCTCVCHAIIKAGLCIEMQRAFPLLLATSAQLPPAAAVRLNYSCPQ